MQKTVGGNPKSATKTSRDIVIRWDFKLTMMHRKKLFFNDAIIGQPLSVFLLVCAECVDVPAALPASVQYPFYLGEHCVVCER